MKNIALFLVITLLASCSQMTTKSPAEQIKQKQVEISKLNQEINELKKLIKTETTDKTEKKAVNVKILTVEAQDFNHYFQSTGKIEAIEAAFISPEMNGQIDKIYVEEGQRVQKGQKLAKIKTDILESTIEELKTSLELTELIYEKQKRLFEQKVGSELEYLRAKNNMESLRKRIKTSESQMDLAYIKAPISGIIDNIFSKEGELAIPGSQLMQLVNLSEVKLNINVPDKYLSVIHKNDPVVIEFPAYPDLLMDEKIDRIGNVINDQNLTFEVNISFPNEDEKFKPNTLAIARFNDYSQENAIVLPSILIKEDLIGSYVYTAVNKNGKLTAIKKYVKTSKSYENQTLISSGLSFGDKVISEGYNMVSDGQFIQINQ